MKYRLTCVFLSLMVLILPLSAAADERIVSTAVNGTPSFLTGDLGFVDPIPAASLAKAADDELFRLSAQIFLEDLLIERYGASGAEGFEIRRVKTDRLGKVHVRFDQTLHGLPVVGAQMVVHAEAASGLVYAVNGHFAPAAGVPAPAFATVLPAFLERKLDEAAIAGTMVDPALHRPEMLYFHDAETGLTHLAWKVRVQGVHDGQFFDNDVYLDAESWKAVAVEANVHTAKNRQTYDATGSVVTATTITGLPGTLVCDEANSNCNDASAQRAHDGAGDVYDYYQARFGRDSLNNAGMTLTSSVHVGSNWANAAWYNNQMIYGDGDGTTLDDLTKSFDVIAHELTHGVTDFESDLIYQKESGALNEALSDIFGVSADSWVRGGVVDASTWMLGEEVYTPGTSGDALRYMDDPDLDGYSKGYYPERLYPGSCTPSSANDQCGVHGNSGIANLAYQLLVEGGTHPRGKTSVNVPAIGMAKAEQIFYRAQTTYLTPSSNFSAARDATAQSAADLYGQAEIDAVHDAWCAVGVPGCPASGGGQLQNGVAETGLSGSTGSQQFFTIEIPAGATNLTVTLSGGTGDADLYVKFGSQPTTSSYDCRSWNSSNNESCSFASPSTGTYHVLIHAYATFSGASLTATWDEPGASCGGSGSASNLSGSSGTELRYTFTVDACATTATFKISGGTGDADLYVKFGSQPTTSSYDCRPYLNGNNETCTFSNPSAGTWHIMVRGFTSFSGVLLEASYE